MAGVKFDWIGIAGVGVAVDVEAVDVEAVDVEVPWILYNTHQTFEDWKLLLQHPHGLDKLGHICINSEP